MANYTVTVGGVSGLTVQEGTLDIELAIARRSTCAFNLVDTNGAYHFTQGASILLYDTRTALAFGGFVQKVREKKMGYAPTIIHTITGMDYHYLADKRIVAASYLATTTDAIAKNIVSGWLAAEGVVTLPASPNLFSTQQASTESATFPASPAYLPASGVTFAQDTTLAWDGLASLRLVFDGSFTFQSISLNLPAASFVAGGTYTVSLYARAQVGQTPSLRMFFEGNDQITGNHAIGSTPSVSPVATGWTRYSVTATMPNPITDTYIGLRVDTGGTAQAITVWLDGLQMEHAATASMWQLPGAPASVAAGVSVGELVFNYDSAASAFDKLAKMDGYWWAIDKRRVFWYQPYTGVPAPWVFDGTQAEQAMTTVDHGNNEYRNRQWVTGSKDKTSTQTQSFHGDGATRSFTLGYQLAKAPTITVNGVAQTVGIKQVDTGKQWYWAEDDAVIVQDPSGTVLVGGVTPDTLAVTYIGEYPIVAISSDTAKINAEAALEGVGTGYVEAKYESAVIKSTSDAFQVANALISHYGQSVTTLTFGTLIGGLTPGQLLSVNLAAHNLTGVSMLIENVKINDLDGVNVWYTITAMGAAHDANWQTFWVNLMSKSQIQLDQSNQATPQIVAMLESEPLAFTWTMAETETVFACPVPSSTLFPSATLYPC